jgi:Arc/MetJ family transcription regulator
VSAPPAEALAAALIRSRFRVTGLARVSPMSLSIIIAANLRLAQTFLARQEEAADDAARAETGQTRQRRTPSRGVHNQLRHELRARIDAVKASPVAGDARAAGPRGP